MNHRPVLPVLMLICTLTLCPVPGYASDAPPSVPDMPEGAEHPMNREEPSSVVATPQTLKTAVKQTTGLISTRISQAVSTAPETGKKFRKPIFGFHEYGTGLSAGDDEQNIGLGVWGNMSFTNSEDEHFESQSDFDLYNFLTGIDYKITDKMIAGVSFSYEDMDGPTYYNAGNMAADGFTISPYFAAMLTNYLSFDVTAGFSRISIDQDRNRNGLFGPDIISSSLDAERMFIASNLNGYYSVRRWNLSANLEYLYAEDDQDAFRESNGNEVPSVTIHFGQISLGSEVSYSFDSVEPYLNLAYEYDTVYDENVLGTAYTDYDCDGFVLGGGLRFLLFSVLQGDIQFSSILARDEYEEYSLTGNLRFDF